MTRWTRRGVGIDLRALSQLVLVSLAALVGCSKGSTPEQLTARRIDVMQELGMVLSTITDRDSAVAHEQRVAEIIDEMNTLRRHFKWLTEREKRAIHEAASARAPEMKAASDKMRHELTRIEASTDIQSVLGPLIGKL